MYNMLVDTNAVFRTEQQAAGVVGDDLHRNCPLRKNSLVIESSLCLSRACLGKNIAFICIMAKKDRFRPPERSAATRGNGSRCRAARNSAVRRGSTRAAGSAGDILKCRNALNPPRSPPRLRSTSSQGRAAETPTRERKTPLSFPQLFATFVPSLSW